MNVGVLKELPSITARIAGWLWYHVHTIISTLFLSSHFTFTLHTPLIHSIGTTFRPASAQRTANKHTNIKIDSARALQRDTNSSNYWERRGSRRRQHSLGKLFFFLPSRDHEYHFWLVCIGNQSVHRKKDMDTDTEMVNGTWIPICIRNQ